MRICRQLTYSIPLEVMSRTSLIQGLIATEAMNINKRCLITYESLHTTQEIFSTMVLTMVVDIDKCDYVHRAMQKVIALMLQIYSPSTETIYVTDEPVMTRDFNVEEII